MIRRKSLTFKSEQAERLCCTDSVVQILEILEMH